MIEVTAYLSNDRVLFFNKESCELHEWKQENFGSKKLSKAENAVIKLVNPTGTNKDIADILEIEVQTVKKHLSNIYSKLKVKNKTELIVTLDKFKRRKK